MAYQPQKKREKKPPFNNYIKYTQLAFQMIIVMAIGVFAGIKIDQWIDLGFPLFTLLLSLLGVGTAIYMAIRNFM